MKILAIELDSSYEMLYRKKLAFLKYDLDFVKTKEAALKKLQKKPYDLILVAHYLKNTTGMEVCRRIRDLGYTGNILITAPGNHLKEIQQCYSNICEVINKGSNSEDFVNTIKKYAPRIREVV